MLQTFLYFTMNKQLHINRKMNRTAKIFLAVSVLGLFSFGLMNVLQAKNGYLNSTNFDSSLVVHQNFIDSIGTIIYGKAKRESDLSSIQVSNSEDSLLNYSLSKRYGQIKAELVSSYVQHRQKIQTGKVKTDGELDSLLHIIQKNLNATDSFQMLHLGVLDKEIVRVRNRDKIYQIEKKRKQIEDSLIVLSNIVEAKFHQLPAGGYARKIFSKKVRFFISDSSFEIKMLYNKEMKPVSIEEIRQSDKRPAEMITNGGMFESTYESVGLFIENGSARKAADTIGNKEGNFYLLPNGIYFIDTAGKSNVLETKEFIRDRYTGTNRKKEYPTIRYATQSGPLLLFNGQFNKNIKFNSINDNIRNGVGVMRDGRTVFIKSDEPINFMQFAMIFKYFFNCKNALYLDGYISKMYAANKESVLPFTNDSGGHFGPMISVFKKQHK